MYNVCARFFFKQKTAYEMRIRDWSSDVGSSALAVRAGGSGKARLDRGDERAARPLQPVDLGIGVEDGHAFALEHHCRGRFPHADRSGEPEDERPAEPRAGALPSPHAISSARSSSSRSTEERRGGQEWVST